MIQIQGFRELYNWVDDKDIIFISISPAQGKREGKKSNTMKAGIKNLSII